LVFPTEHGKAVFFPRPHMMPAEMPDAEHPFVLNTGRLQHQWHTMTKTGKIPTLNKLNPGPFIEIHPEDATQLGIKEKDQVEVRSRRGHAILPAVVTDRVRPGNCFAPFHWNDVFGDDLAINAVTNDAIDPISQQPEFKFCAVAMTRVATPSIEQTSKNNVADSDNDVRADASAGEATTITEEDAMRIDALAKILGIETIPAIELDGEEQQYLSGYITGLRSSELRKAGEVPALPISAPLVTGKRLWVDGLLAGLFARSYVANTDEPVVLPLSLQSPRLEEPMASPIVVLWASQTGNAEDFAKRCAESLNAAGHTTKLDTMDNYPVAELAKVQNLLLISSTFGDGDPPDNGAGFWSALSADGAPKLEQTNFSVLAFGDSSYDQFCGHGKKLDARLEALGAKRMARRADCEPEYQEHAQAWLKAVITSLEAVKVTQQELVTVSADVYVKEETDKKETKVRFDKNNPLQAQIACNVLLSQVGATKETRQFAFTIPDANFSYEAGDALGVWPSNCEKLVAELIIAAGLSSDATVHVDGHGEVTLHVALLKHYEIARITPDFLKLVFDSSKNSDLGKLLQDDNKAELKDWLWGKQTVDVLYAFPAKLEVQSFLKALKRLQPRLYSISSSPKATSGEVHITVSTVRYKCEDKQRKGVCSTFMADFSGDATVPIFVQKSANFRPPTNPETPMIMVGPGTGIAPFRAFLQERHARKDTGKNWLFFGEQHAATDFYYKDEIEAWQKDGFLTKLDLAFSRDQAEKVYVQDRMREQGAELWEWLEAGAHFYVCGDASRMAKDVDQALREAIQKHGGLSEDAAKAYVQKLASDKRYVRDVY